MNECMVCGEPLAPEDKSCPMCGTSVTNPIGPPPRPSSPPAPPREPEKPTVSVPRPPAGSVCLVVYSADRQPLHYQPLDRDVTLIGRTDAVGGTFADLDLGQLLDEATARKVSRKHALVLRSRETGSFVLRPLARNTGTQIERDLAEPLRDYPLADGTRIILGGSVRLKFEVVK
jgi:hypothetical protein